jgi:peptidoglycan/LPS O-acetylase OafA/YrhL
MDKVFIMEPGVLHAVLRIFVAFAITVAVSAVSYAIIEKPFLNLKRRFTFIESRPVQHGSAHAVDSAGSRLFHRAANGSLGTTGANDKNIDRVPDDIVRLAPANS